MVMELSSNLVISLELPFLHVMYPYHQSCIFSFPEEKRISSFLPNTSGNVPSLLLNWTYCQCSHGLYIYHFIQFLARLVGSTHQQEEPILKGRSKLFPKHSSQYFLSSHWTASYIFILFHNYI